MTDFDPDAYLTSKGVGTSPLPASVPAVDNVQVTQFDPDAYLNGKTNDSAAKLQAKYGGVGNEALAALAGGARAATLGGSDVALTKSGLVSPETLSGLKEANPKATFAGNLIGGGALTSLTGGLAAPIEAGIGAGVLGSAVGFGAEGAAFGVGNVISDHALGDPNLSAQKVLADVGLGAIFGAALGAGAGALKGKLGAVSGRLAKASDEAVKAADTAEAMTASSIPKQAAEESEKGLTGLFGVNNVQKLEAPEIAASLKKHGLDVLPEFTSANKYVQQAGDAVTTTAPTIFGVLRKNAYEKVYEAGSKIINDVLDTGSQFGGGELTPATLGSSLQESLATKVGAEFAPLTKMYETLEQSGVHVPISKPDVTSLSKEILAMPEARSGFASERIAKSVAKNILKQENVSELTDYATQLKNSVNKMSPRGERDVVMKIADLVEDLREGSIIKAARNSGLPEDAQKAMTALADEYQLAKKAYAGPRKDLNELVQWLGRKEAGGPQTVINFIKNELEPEDLAQKLFSAGKKYKGFGEFLSKKYPEEYALLQQYQKQSMLNAATKNDVFSPQTFFTAFDKLTPEIQKTIFAADELANIQDAKNLLVKALPKNFNPSNSGKQSAFLDFFKNPATALGANLRDLGMVAFIKANSILPEAVRPNPYELGAEIGKRFNKLSAIQKVIGEVDNKIGSGIKSIVSTGPEPIRGAALGAVSSLTDSGYDRITKNVEAMSRDPQGFLDQMEHHAGDVHNGAPNVGQSLNNSMVTGLQFLQSKIPKPTMDLPLSKKWTPSETQKKTFMRYYSAVNDPVSVLKQVKNGTLTNEAMEALTMVHPELLKQMQKELLSSLRAPGAKKMNYATKIGVAKFLHAPLDQNMLPQVITANQLSLSGPQLGNQSAPKNKDSFRQSGIQKMNPSERAATQTRDTELDRD